MLKAFQRLMMLWLLVTTQSVPVSSQQGHSDSRPVLDMHFATDSWFVSDLPALDSPATIRDAVQMWADLFHIKRMYSRVEEEEIDLASS